MAGNLDSYQMLTLIFGGFIIMAALLEYNDTTYNANFKALVRTAEGALPLFFAAYALISSSAKGKEASMYKNLILVLSIGALTIVTVQKSINGGGSSSGWDAVNERVTLPLATGALFALPVALLGFRA